MTNTSIQSVLDDIYSRDTIRKILIHIHKDSNRVAFDQNLIETRIAIVIMTVEQSTPTRYPYHHWQSLNHYDGTSRSFRLQFADTDKSTTYRTNHWDDYILTILIYELSCWRIFSRFNTGFSIKIYQSPYSVDPILSFIDQHLCESLHMIVIMTIWKKKNSKYVKTYG